MTPLPSLRPVEPASAPTATNTSPPVPKVYPEYVPRTSASPVLALAGAFIAGGMVYRAAK